jgi:hypothetical protein
MPRPSRSSRGRGHAVEDPASCRLRVNGGTSGPHRGASRRDLSETDEKRRDLSRSSEPMSSTSVLVAETPAQDLACRPAHLPITTLTCTGTTCRNVGAHARLCHAGALEPAIYCPLQPAAQFADQQREGRGRQKRRRRHRDQQPGNQCVPHRRRLRRDRPKNVTAKPGSLTTGT